MTHHAIFLDIETTGLDMTHDFILEIGMVLVDTRIWVPVEFWSSYVAEPGWQDRLKENEYVWNMHQKSGLLRDMPPVSTNFSSLAVMSRMGSKLGTWTERTGGKPPVWGSSVHFDRKFLNTQMRGIDDKFSHRNVDSSSTLERLRVTHPSIAQAVYDEPEFKARKTQHRVIPDCLDSITIERLLDKHAFSRVPLINELPGGSR